MMKRKGRVIPFLLSIILSANMVTAVFAENTPSVSDNSVQVNEDKVLEVEEIREAIADAEYVEDEIILVTKDEECLVVELPEETDVAEAIAEYQEASEVLFAQPNFIYETEEVTTLYSANDPYQSYQYYLDSIGVYDAWDLVSGRNLSDISVAVIDTGVQPDHVDLYANIDLKHSVNIYDDSFSQVTEDSSGHGTHIAGIIGAMTNNGIGIQGIANNHAKIAVLRCSNESNKITTSTVIQALDYAVSLKVRVINISLGMYTKDNALENALQRAYNAGIVIVCSGGNDGTDRTHYPSAYSMTLGVIATDKTGNKMTSSNMGTDNFISAPGASIYSTLPGNHYGSNSGTSMASAVVTGCVAFLLSIDPSLSQQQIKDLLAKTATDTYESGFDEYSGYGIIDLEGAAAELLKNLPSSVKIPEEVKNPTSVENFVKRLYYYCLDRQPEEEGYRYWVNELKRYNINGGEAAYGFLCSREFVDKNLSDAAYVTLLYRVFLGREPDKSGKAYWIGLLSNGMSRAYVMNGFSNSPEFANICNACGFKSGQMALSEERDINKGTTAYVTRLYTMALERSYDVDGLNYWCGRLNNNGVDAYTVAIDGFFHSPEFLNKKTDNSEFVKILYRTFLDREYDAPGYRYWLNLLNSGTSRDQIIAEFANSPEFKKIMEKYGF